jgi:hypothetical protein
MMSQSPAEKIINRFIARNPQMTLEFLQSENIPLSTEPSLDEITKSLYEKYFENDKAFNTRLGELIANGDNIGFIITASIIIAIVGVGVSGGIAIAKFNKDKKIAENQSEVDKLRIQITTQAQLDADRNKILASSVTDYKQSLQEQSSQRRKTAIIFVAGIAVIGIVAVIILRK